MLFDLFSDNEKDMMKNWIETYGGSSGEPISLKVPLSEILKFWDEAKGLYLYHMLGDNFIITKSISINKSDDMLDDDIREKIYSNRKISSFIEEFRNVVRTLDIPRDARDELLEVFYNNHSLITNKYEGEPFTINFENNKPYLVNRECKLSKMIGKISSMYNVPYYEDFRIAHSMVLNQKMFSGELCMSIHPMDYMTMSDNNCNWESCMNWTGEGDYRMGTVEMMNSPCVVMCYLKSNHPYDVGCDMTWNNKRWRELFVVNEDVITGALGYPYWDTSLEKICVEWIKELAEKNLHYNFKDTLEHFQMGRIFKNSEDIEYLIYLRTHCMYNDFHETHPLFIGKNADTNLGFYYSGATECMCCGEELDWEDQETSSVCCDDCCGGGCKCDECGDRYRSSQLYEVDGEMICENCLEDYTSPCDICEETHFTNGMTEVHLAIDEDHISTVYHVLSCDNCLHSSAFTELFGTLYSKIEDSGFYEEKKFYVLMNEISEDGLKTFGIFSKKEFDDIKAELLEEE